MGPAHLNEAHDEDYVLMHPVYTSPELKNVKILHKNPKKTSDKVAYTIVQTLRTISDLPMFMGKPYPSENQVLNRVIFLETVAGVPGMAAGK